MAKNKYHYYVLVFSSDGPVYVTSLEHDTKYAHWDKDQNPLELSDSWAEDLVLGLCWNGHNAALIRSRIEITTQPYRYSDYDCKFIVKEDALEP